MVSSGRMFSSTIFILENSLRYGDVRCGMDSLGPLYVSSGIDDRSVYPLFIHIYVYCILMATMVHRMAAAGLSGHSGLHRGSLLEEGRGAWCIRRVFFYLV